MPDYEFAPDKFIDRTAEQELFDNLFKFKDDARLLVIRDVGGTGKSHLLKMLHYKCEWTHEVPASLLILDDPALNTPFAFISVLRMDLDTHLKFATFDVLNNARMARDFSPFSNFTASLQGTLDARHATITKSAKVGGVIIDKPKVKKQIFYDAPKLWSAEQENYAQKACVNAFLQDLKSAVNEQPIVVLLDAWELAEVKLKEWIESSFLKPLCFSPTGSNRLIVVLAGRVVPDFRVRLGEQRFNQLIRYIAWLTAWDRKHLKDLFSTHGYNVGDEELTLVLKYLNSEMWTLQRALTMVASFTAKEG